MALVPAGSCKLIPLSLFVILSVAGYAGLREGVKRLVFENPDYHVQTIELQTDGTLQREQVLKAADLHEGTNIFSVNLARVRDRIQELPQADEVEVVRKLPSEIDIRILERKHVAWITSETEINDPFASDAAFLVGARGVLMTQKKLLPEYLGLPLIVGCSSEALEAGTVWVNCFNVFDTASPFGGYKESGYGRELGHYALELYTQTKSVWVAL